MDRCSIVIMCMPLMMFLMVGTTLTSLVDAQAVPECANPTLPCIDYLNSTNPPDICCNPLKEISTTQESCFCVVFAPGLLQSFGTNTTMALRLLNSCGVHFDATICKASASALPPSVQVQPPSTPGGDTGGASRITFTGLGFVLFIWASKFSH